MDVAQLVDLASEREPQLNADVATGIARAAVNAVSVQGELLDRRARRQRKRDLRRAALKAAFDLTNAATWIRLLGFAAYLLPGPVGIAVRTALFIAEKLLE